MATSRHMNNALEHWFVLPRVFLATKAGGCYCLIKLVKVMYHTDGSIAIIDQRAYNTISWGAICLLCHMNGASIALM